MDIFGMFEGSIKEGNIEHWASSRRFMSPVLIWNLTLHSGKTDFILSYSLILFKIKPAHKFYPIVQRLSDTTLKINLNKSIQRINMFIISSYRGKCSCFHLWTGSACISFFLSLATISKWRHTLCDRVFHVNQQEHQTSDKKPINAFVTNWLTHHSTASFFYEAICSS